MEEVYLFRQGTKKSRNGKLNFISKTPTGKVIIARNCNSAGFYTLSNVVEKTSCVLADVTPVFWDYYDGISYEDLKSVLSNLGFKLAFEMPFTYKYRGNSESQEMRLVMYSESTHMIVVADTFNVWNSFSSIECYCYGVRGNDIGLKLFSRGSSDVAVFDAVRTHEGGRPLHLIMSYSCKNPIDKIDLSDVPNGWTYASETDMDYDFYRDDFLKRCPDDLRSWFK